MNAQQLKNSILQMAIQGKLVPQDPNDEPASVLIERIREEKEKLIKEKKIKKEKNPSFIFRGADNITYEKVGKNEPVSIEEELPFEIPNSWEWCRLGDIFSTRSGLSYKKAVLNTKSDKMIRILRGGNIADEKIIFKDDDISIASEYVKSELYLKRNYLITPSVSSLEHIGKIALIDKDYSNVVVGGFVLMLSPHYNNRILSEYFLYALASKYHRDNCRAITHKSGQAFYNISRDKMMNLFIPLPPLAEQERIVTKLEELLPLVERYGDKQNSLDKLKNDFPVLLKKSILQEAVQGRLVPQDPSDEPASVLLERIREEKQRLIKEGKIKKDKNESIIYRRDNSHYEKLNGIERCIDDEIPFEIPESWCWVRLGTVLQKLTDGAHSTPKYVESGIPFISVKDISTGKLGFANCKFITVEEHSELYKRCNPEKGDILLTKVGTTGIPVIVDTEEEFSLFVSVALLKFNQTMMYNKYLIALINSPLVQKQADENTRGVGNKNWVMRDIANTLIALPPLLEQHRIVQKLNDIFLILKNF